MTDWLLTILFYSFALIVIASWATHAVSGIETLPAPAARRRQADGRTSEVMR